MHKDSMLVRGAFKISIPPLEKAKTCIWCGSGSLLYLAEGFKSDTVLSQMPEPDPDLQLGVGSVALSKIDLSSVQ